MTENVAITRWNPRLAHVVDVVLAAATMLLLSPLLLLLAAAVWLTSGRPVLFAQQRLGRGGVPFWLHKFRTLATADGLSVAPSNDARTTPLGRVLRRSHLDELPQLFDVLRGKMALVGPRPEVPANLIAVEPARLAELLTVRPGITGPTQLAFVAEDDVLAGCDDPVRCYRQMLVPAKVEQDLAWLARRSLAADLAVLVKTPFSLASRRARAASFRRVAALLGC